MPTVQEPIVLEKRPAECDGGNAACVPSGIPVSMRAMRHAFYGREDEIRSHTGKDHGLVGDHAIGNVTGIRGVAPVAVR